MTLSLREALIQELKGKTIRIKNLGNILPGWPQVISPDIKEFRDQIEAWLDTYEPFCQLLFMTSFVLRCYPF